MRFHLLVGGMMGDGYQGVRDESIGFVLIEFSLENSD
jgi:hypothetical protein